MKTCTGVAFVTAAVVSLVVMSGCVSEVEYNKIRTAARRANEELQKSQESLRMEQAKNAELLANSERDQAMLEAKNKEVELLESNHRELEARYERMKGLYEQAQRPAPPPPVKIIVLPTEVDRALREFAASNTELVDYMPEYGMVKFKADLTFEKGKDDVSSSASQALGKLVEILKTKAANEFHVYVAGHTDDIPILKPTTKRRHPNNWYLSVHRAVEVQKVLEAAGLGPERIAVMGFGEYHPIASNAPGKKGNEKNRRVEIWIVSPDRLLTGPVEGSAK